MAKTYSNMLALGTKAFDLKLPDCNGKNFELSDFTGKGLLIAFICNHCPFVKHINQGLVKLANDYMKQGIDFVAINSNDSTTYPEDSPEKMKDVAKELNYPFPYLIDESQDVARNYFAACTPDFYLFNSKRELIYRGQMDESRPDSDIPVTGNDLRKAFDCLLSDKEIDFVQKPSIGCSIKWKLVCPYMQLVGNAYEKNNINTVYYLLKFSSKHLREGFY